MPKLTDEQLQALERRYRPKAIPPCPVCGGPLMKLGTGNSYGCQATMELITGSQDLITANSPNAVAHVQQSRWDRPRQWDEQVAALIQEVRESRLPGHEQLDLVQTDTAREVLQAAYADVAAVMPPPIGEPAFEARYRELVLEALAKLLRQWDAAPREDARS